MTAVQPSAPTTVTGLLGLLGDAEFRDDGNVITVEVPPSRLEAAVHHLAASGARLADLFAADGDRVTLRLVWALDTERQYLITQSPVAGGEYPALSDIAPAAFYEECEIYEQFGIRPATGKPLNRVAMPPWSRCITGWSPAAKRSSTCTCSPGTSTAGWNGGCGAALPPRRYSTSS